MTSKATKFCIRTFLCGVAAWATLAQTQDVTQAPPPATFEEWREIRRDEETIEYELFFPSPVLSGNELNDRVRIRALVPLDRVGPVPAVVILHYWGALDLKLETSIAVELNRRGIAGIIVTLPYHLTRTPKGFRSGELAIQPDPDRMIATMFQSVQDVRRTLDWVLHNKKEFQTEKIGIVGTSLGSLVAALTYAVDDRLKAACFLLGGADLAHILWNSSRVTSERETLRRRGYTESKLRKILQPIEPLEYLKPDPNRRAYVIGAMHDTVMPNVDTQKLIDALGKPDVLWLRTGHYGGALVERPLTNSIARFFESVLNGRSFQAPDRLYAPSIRLGLQINDEHGLQVAAGVDLWRSNRAGDGFAGIFITARGLQGFVGYRLTRDLAAGVTILPKRTTWGILWSIVL